MECLGVGWPRRGEYVALSNMCCKANVQHTYELYAQLSRVTLLVQIAQSCSSWGWRDSFAAAATMHGLVTSERRPLMCLMFVFYCAVCPVGQQD